MLKLPNDIKINTSIDFNISDEIIEVEKIPCVRSNIAFVMTYDNGDSDI